MKKYSTIVCLVLACSGSMAQHGESPLKWLSPKNGKADFVYIPTKSFSIPDVSGKDSAIYNRNMIKTTRGFFASRFEVTNKEYREFVVYTRDSIAHGLLGHRKPNGHLNWNKTIDWNDPLLTPMRVSEEDVYFGIRPIDSEKILYGMGEESIAIYPDTLVWIRDFTYSYNEPLVKKYFAHKAYDNYPVVGINLQQTKAFCHWKTARLNEMLKQKKGDFEVRADLPSIAEWEAAAINGEDDKKINSATNYRSNFGPIRDSNGFLVKNYDDDGFFYTNPVQHFQPGPNGLYGMKGNIAEWTADGSVKGGGWHSEPYFLQTGVNEQYSVDAAHSYIGFRYIVHVIKK